MLSERECVMFIEGDDRSIAHSWPTSTSHCQTLHTVLHILTHCVTINKCFKHGNLLYILCLCQRYYRILSTENPRKSPKMQDILDFHHISVLCNHLDILNRLIWHLFLSKESLYFAEVLKLGYIFVYKKY